MSTVQNLEISLQPEIDRLRAKADTLAAAVQEGVGVVTEQIFTLSPAILAAGCVREGELLGHVPIACYGPRRPGGGV